MELTTLIIYDNEGNIFLQMSGNYSVPQGGIQYLEVDSSVHLNKVIKSVNPKTKELVMEDIPKTDIELLQEELAETTKNLAEKESTIKQLQNNIADLTKQLSEL